MNGPGTAPTEQAWRSAEQKVRGYFEAKGHKVDAVRRVPSIPYFFLVGFDDGRDYALVFAEQIVEKKGIDALADYLRASNFLRRRTVTGDDFFELIQHVDAYPPDRKSRSLFLEPSKPELHPRIIWSARSAHFVLHYQHIASTPPGGGSRPDADTVELEEWTLEIPESYALSWSSRVVTVHPK